MSTINLITPLTYPRELATGLLRELDTRTRDGVSVRLLWDPNTDRAIVEVERLSTGERFTLTCETQDNPLDVFHHPYFYAALRSPNAA